MTGRSVVVARVFWEDLVRVRFSAPRPIELLSRLIYCRDIKTHTKNEHFRNKSK